MRASFDWESRRPGGATASRRLPHRRSRRKRYVHIRLHARIVPKRAPNEYRFLQPVARCWEIRNFVRGATGQSHREDVYPPEAVFSEDVHHLHDRSVRRVHRGAHVDRLAGQAGITRKFAKPRVESRQFHHFRIV